MDGRKVHPSYMHPVDNVVLDNIDRVSGLLHGTFPNLTPNTITTVGNILRFSGVWLLYTRQYALCAALLIFGGLMCDFMDGHYARKYGMVTTFGDYYDHYSDVVWGVCLLGVLAYVYNVPWYLYVGIGVLVLIGCIHFGSREALRMDPSPTSEWSQYIFRKSAFLFGKDPHKVATRLRYIHSEIVLAGMVSLLAYYSIRYFQK